MWMSESDVEVKVVVLSAQRLFFSHSCPLLSWLSFSFINSSRVARFPCYLWFILASHSVTTQSSGTQFSLT